MWKLATAIWLEATLQLYLERCKRLEHPEDRKLHVMWALVSRWQR